VRTCPWQFEMVSWILPAMIAMLVPRSSWRHFTSAVAKPTIAFVVCWAVRKELRHALLLEGLLGVTDVVEPLAIKRPHLIKVVAGDFSSQPTITSPASSLSRRTCASD
jgi:hypothetical protein